MSAREARPVRRYRSTKSSVNDVRPFLVLPVEHAGPARPWSVNTAGRSGLCLHIRNEPSVDEDPRLELDELDMLAVALRKLGDLWFAPRVYGDLEGSSRLDAWDEAIDDGQSH